MSTGGSTATRLRPTGATTFSDCSVAANSPGVENLSSGSFASAFATARSSHRGTPGFRAPRRGAVSAACFASKARGVFDSNGGRPATISKSTQPMA